ncbi:hypothetical protein L484_019115 [Morus notabilis]|uniref:Uncharacterized protein n=1 Tax=Morus notabilis TaxID=981085 RepID=W9SBC8_9ROSA|nr:hypothetical protein L484_019115 [Morus notabilis]
MAYTYVIFAIGSKSGGRLAAVATMAACRSSTRRSSPRSAHRVSIDLRPPHRLARTSNRSCVQNRRGDVGATRALLVQGAPR